MAENVVSTPASRLESGRPARVWYGVLAGPAGWLLLGTIDWFVTGRACVDGNPSWGVLSPAGVRGLLIAPGAAALAGTAAALRQSWRSWHTLSDRVSLTQAYGHGIAEYLSIAGVAISAVFLIAIVWTVLPALVVDICQGTR